MASIKRLLIFVVAAFTVASCIPNKRLIYLQPDHGKEHPDSVFTYERVKYRLQVNDIIDVNIRSMNAEANMLFNGLEGGGGRNMMGGGMMMGGGDIYYMTGYTVNDTGYIELPVIGYIRVQGLTIEETKKVVEQEVEKYFSRYTLTVRLGGIRYSTLGEFNAAMKHTVLQNQLTIFEAIAQAGDLNSLADRENLLLIRQYPDGTRFHRINLLDDSVIGSPYYFIQPNDVLYAEPLPQKTWGVGVTGTQSLTTIFSIVSSSIALGLTIISLSSN